MSLITCQDCQKEFSALASKCPNCDWPNQDVATENWEFQYAWKWFEIHVQHRNSMFNYWLISIGLFATAYVQSRINEPTLDISAWIAITATLATIAFFYLHLITLIKIQRSKISMAELLPKNSIASSRNLTFQKLLGTSDERYDEGSGDKYWYKLDPFWTGVVHVSIASLSVLAFCDVLLCDNVFRLLGVIFILAIMGIPFFQVLRRWFSGKLTNEKIPTKKA